VSQMVSRGVEAIVYCGDITGREIIQVCSELPRYFVLGKHEGDNAPQLEQAAKDYNATCLYWCGVIALANRMIAITHGRLTSDMRPFLGSSARLPINRAFS
jgi:uncharacterized protein